MTKVEVLKLLNKIKVYYPNFSLEDYVKEEWIEKLKPYDNEDVLKKLDEHLKGDKSKEPPKLHYITKFLKTPEEKKRYTGDFIVDCNLCGKTMTLEEYDKEHYKKCLLIKSLIPILKARGEDVDYNKLDEYNYETLDRVWDKYNPQNTNLSNLVRNVANGRRSD